MKIACGTKSQVCKDNRSVVDLRFCLCFGTSATATVERAAVGSTSSSPPARREHAPTVAFTSPHSSTRLPSQCRALAANEPAGASAYAQREAMRRERIQRETEAALRDSGLRLAPEER